MTESKFIVTATDLDDILAPRNWFRSAGNKIFAAGQGSGGQLGNNSIANVCSFVQETSTSGAWRSVSGGSCFGIATKNNGTLWGWGANNFGQLGNGTNIARSSPSQEASLSSDWRQVSAGLFSSGAIKTDNTLWMWGSNNCGQLIDGTKTNKSSPVQEFTGSSWASVSSSVFSGSQFGAIKTDGTLWMWGDGSRGILGDGFTIYRSSPTQEVSESNNWSSLSIGSGHSAAIKNDGTLWSWGCSVYSGAVGDGFTTDRCSPAQELTSSTNWKQVAAGGSFTQAVKEDGTLWGWGSTLISSIGTTCSPVEENTSATDWYITRSTVVTGSAIKTDGTLWMWGINDVGQTGLGDTTQRNAPTKVGVKTTWKDIQLGLCTSYAIEMSDTLC